MTTFAGREEGRNVLNHTCMHVYVHADTHARACGQNFVLRHLIEDQALLLDLSGDYSSPINQSMIPTDDPRQGQTLFDLMLSQDHLKYKYNSLFMYHVSSLEILALCASQNRVSQLMIQGMLPLTTVLDSILALNAREEKYEKIDLDTLCLAKGGWIQLLASAYLTSNDPDIGNQIEHIASTHIVSTYGKHLDDVHEKLLADVTTTIKALTKRLGKLESRRTVFARRPQKLDGEADTDGKNLWHHFEYALSCVRMATCFCKTWKDRIKLAKGGQRHLLRDLQALHSEAADLRKLSCVFQFDSLSGSLKTLLHATGCEKETEHRLPAEKAAVSALTEMRRFHEDWMSFLDNFDKQLVHGNKQLQSVAAKSSSWYGFPQVQHTWTCQDCGLRGEGGSKDPDRCSDTSGKWSFYWGCCNCALDKHGWSKYESHGCPQCKERRASEKERALQKMIEDAMAGGVIEERKQEEIDLAKAEVTRAQKEAAKAAAAAQASREIMDLASLFGSKDTHCNADFEVLRALMLMLSSDACDDSFRVQGLNILRAILYFNPQYMPRERQEQELHNFWNNLPPSYANDLPEQFCHLQQELASAGCVHVVCHCVGFCNGNDVVLSAALQLAVTLAEGGDDKVHKIFR